MKETRKTDRVTQSSSTTSTIGIPTFATQVPRDLIFQARLDVRNDMLWRKPKVREVLRFHLIKYQHSGQLTEATLGKIYNIVAFNDSYRARTLYDAALDVPLDAPSPTVPPPDEVDEPDLAEEEPPTTPGGVEDVHFNPPLAASYIGEGWGFKNGAIVERLRKHFTDFPKPVPSSARKMPLYWFDDIDAWTGKHGADIIHARTRGVRLTSARDDRISELEAQIAALKAQLQDRKSA